MIWDANLTRLFLYHIPEASNKDDKKYQDIDCSSGSIIRWKERFTNE